MEEHSAAIQAVLAVERRWTEAHLSMDLGAIEGMLSDRYRHFGPDGSISGKEELLASYGSGERHWDVAESDDHHVEILGEVAVLTGRWRGKGVNAGEKFDYSARFICLYVQDEGEWRLFLDATIGE